MSKVEKSTTTKVLKDQAKPYAIRLTYEPEGNEKTMLQRVYTRYNSMKDSPDRKKAEGEWDRGRKQWEAMREERSDEEWQSNHYVPLTTSVVESALSEVIDESPEPLILPRGGEDETKAEAMSHIFEYTWEISDSDLEFEDIIHDAFIEGTGIGQEYFYSDIRKIKTSRVKADDPRDWNEEDKVSYNDCYLECVKNDDFFVDENARNFRGPYAARDCIRRYIMNIDDFKTFFKGKVWDPLDNAKLVTPGGNTDYYEWYKPPAGIDKKSQVEVLWYWSIKPDDWLVIVANDVLVFMGPNPYKHKELPFARAIDVKRTHKFYGKGEAALLESIQDEMNTLRRMIIDRNHLDIDKMFIGSNRLNLSEEDLIARPHGFIPTDDKDALKAVEYGDIPRSVELSLSHLQDDGTVVTGINPRAQALPTAGTATEAAILKESTLKRIRLKVRRLEREFLTRVARLRVSNILQYYPQAKLEKIIGEKETADYKQKVADLQSKGLLVQQPDPTTGEMGDYKKTYREIRLQNVEMMPTPDGDMKPTPKEGFSFFPLNPQYFVPNRGGYDIKFAAGSTLPISKPMLKQQVTDMYDRLIQLAIGVPNTYSPKKLGDALIKINDMNPSDFSADQVQAAQDDQSNRLQMSLELATMENNLMMRGKKVPPTAYQPAAHTLVHIQFTKSPTFQALKKEDPIVQNMVDHITGEIAALQERDQGTVASPVPGQDPNAAPAPGQGAPIQGQGNAPGVGTPQTPTVQAGANVAMQNALPGKIQGGGQAPAL